MELALDPDRPNPCSTPLVSAGGDGQIMNGSFTIGDYLWMNSTVDPLYVDGKMGIGPDFGEGTEQIDSTALLDVDGQIRIRGMSQVPVGFDPGSVLESVDDSGFAKWVTTPAVFDKDSLQAGYGINLIWNEETKSYTVSTIDSLVQKRVIDSCGDPTALTKINELGAIVPATDCRSFVTTINTQTGGIIGTGQGPNVPVINVGSLTNCGNNCSGLMISGNKLKVNQPVSGSGLLLSGNYLGFNTSACSGTNAYWKYSTTLGWICSTPYPSAATPAGEGVMYLRARKWTSDTLPACPSGSGWTAISPDGTEAAGTAGIVNDVRTCYNSSNLCQVFELKAPTPSSAPSCPSSASGWSQISTKEYIYSTLTTSYNNVNVCYRCVAPS